MDFISEIKRLKAETGVKILAHTYQTPDIISIADITGDSFALAEAATALTADRVIVCGVRFMAETIKILSPEKTVILPAPSATCPMAEQIPPEDIAAFKAAHPGVPAVCYINTTAEFKAECDVCVTSSSAVRIISAMPEQEILFVPDKNLGSYIAAQLPDKKFHFMNGCCPVHDEITADDVLALKAEHPAAAFAVHPECRAEVVQLADFVGATSAIIDYALKQDGDVIIGTERGVVDNLVLQNPERNFIQLCCDKLTCEDMKKVTAESVYRALSGEGGEDIKMNEAVRLAAKKCLDAMLK